MNHNPYQTLDPNFRGTAALIQLADMISNLKGIHFGEQILLIDLHKLEAWKVLQEEYEHLNDLNPDSLISKWVQQFDVIRHMVQIFET